MRRITTHYDSLAQEGLFVMGILIELRDSGANPVRIAVDVVWMLKFSKGAMVVYYLLELLAFLNHLLQVVHAVVVVQGLANCKWTSQLQQSGTVVRGLLDEVVVVHIRLCYEMLYL